MKTPKPRHVLFYLILANLAIFIFFINKKSFWPQGKGNFQQLLLLLDLEVVFEWWPSYLDHIIKKKSDEKSWLCQEELMGKVTWLLVVDSSGSFQKSVISRKRNQNFPPVLMNGDELDTSACFTQLGLSLSSNLTWKTHPFPF